MSVTDPYVEFVYRNVANSATREVVGMRLGFGGIQGDIGLQMNAVSGSLLIDAGASGTIATEGVALFEAAGWLIRSDIQFHWENRGYQCFNDFLAALSSAKRKNLRKERADRARPGQRLRSAGEQHLSGRSAPMRSRGHPTRSSRVVSRAFAVRRWWSLCTMLRWLCSISLASSVCAMANWCLTCPPRKSRRSICMTCMPNIWTS